MNNPTISGFCVKKVFYYLIIQTKLFAKFTSDKKDDFWFTLFKTFSDEKRMIFVIFKCEEKAIFRKSYSKLLLNYNVMFSNISPSFSHTKLVKIAFFITDEFSKCHPFLAMKFKNTINQK